MFKKEYRLRDNGDFQKVFQKGRSAANRQFVVYLLPKERQEQIRVGISVSKKIGNAVTRNKVKRKIREALRLQLDQINLKGDLVVIAREPVVQMEYQELFESLTHCLKKAKLL
ncbi:MAG TPA: ribonuclease P protein component [Bacillota bacterium]|nr:ribonuclease P protein component [Bacillota bacterium]